ncbi:hypothetical protein WA158_001130 [Blastocystis sp. Blastoise]
MNTNTTQDKPDTQVQNPVETTVTSEPEKKIEPLHSVESTEKNDSETLNNKSAEEMTPEELKATFNQYILPSINKRVDNEEPQHKGKRSRNDVGLQKKTNENLCNKVLNGETCENPNCKYMHDLALYMATKPLDIGEKCPVYDIHGYCPQSFCCRWAHAHSVIDMEHNIFKAVKKDVIIPYEEMNNSKDLSFQLKRKQYIFEYKPGTQNEASTTPAVGALGEKEIKGIDYKNKVYIAPLTTLGNLPWRRICVDMGADITTSEMCMANNVIKGQASELALLRRHPSEKCFGVQLAGGFVNDLSYACELIRREFEVDFIDLNCGCPVDAITKVGAGSALLRKETRMKQVITGMLNNLGDIPLLVKCRVGDKEKNLDKLIPKLQALRSIHNERVSAVCIHGRTYKQRYSKLADWDYIKQCVGAQDPSLPAMSILGNGDIFDSQMFYDQMKDGKLDGIMIGRAALIKPWICTEIKENRIWDISAQERLDIIKKYCDYGLEHWGSDQQGIDRTRRYLLEWLSFLCRYIPVGILDRPQRINQHPPRFQGRSDLETLLSSTEVSDWISISNMFLGPVGEDYKFVPKHKSNAYSE